MAPHARREGEGPETGLSEATRAREEFRTFLRGPTSYLAAVARHELPVGESVLLHGHAIEALPDGFRVDGVASGPRTVDAGRCRLRLSHQNAPAIVVLDAEAPRRSVEPQWFPYDHALRFVVALEIDPADLAIGSTREGDRAATRAGWLRFDVDGVACRVMATRLREPGVASDALDVYFSDATSGNETYRMRYVAVTPADGDRHVLDLNLAYNPACVYSPHYNCPIPPPENRIAAAVRAGEMLPRWG